jgi:hypothetical protein
MAVIQHELTIHAPQAEVYAASQDYSVRYQWDPFPEKIELLDGATEVAIGVCTRVVAKSGLRMDVEFVQLAPPARAAIVMTRGPAFIDRFAGSWVFKALDANTTQATFRYVITTKAWAVPPVSEYFAALYFRKVVRARLRGLKQFCERCG